MKTENIIVVLGKKEEVKQPPKQKPKQLKDIFYIPNKKIKKSF